ncbi:helix-turn-helix domain-containing protein [Methylobacterium sp. J-068]|uniref:helix-turn-helix domain-containing protein n=1 Tax=Methylobacterium sp. J-068 TaxID=2836649 RepID=UPI001FBB1DEC|nr:helix-turn-helix domain-containing protein [Methylobacterium sp. J-068]MCJ2037046.1 helix-turn-helix domain-containing protein [Methylobacterium sp. J-068]
MSLPSIDFSTRRLGPEVAFGAYHDLYATGADVARVGDAFHAEVRAYRFDRMILFNRHLNGLAHSRNPTRVRRDAFDHITLHLLVTGEMLAGPPGYERRMRPGEILVLDSSLPQQSRSYGVNVISTPVARDLIEPLVPNIRTFHGAILPESVGGLVCDFLISLTRRSSVVESDVAARSSSVVGTLLACALRGQAPPVDAIVWAGTHDLREDLARRRQAEAFIEANLGDRDLSADSVAAGVAVSRSILYRSFAPDGGVARFVRQRRLERIRQMLRRQGETRSIATLAYAYGFASEHHFNRSFRTAFGQPPGQFRAGLNRRRIEARGHGEAAATLADWLCELA